MDRELTIQQVEQLAREMRKHGRNAVIDWTNRTIRILSDTKVRPDIKLSTGPMEYQDILFQL